MPSQQGLCSSHSVCEEKRLLGQTLAGFLPGQRLTLTQRHPAGPKSGQAIVREIAPHLALPLPKGVGRKSAQGWVGA